MSVIIRLQNLPWSANSLDIRQYFKGLSIPEGGVHIVGGEMGDAFIAFSTDEDARQAMMLGGGKVKEVQITLMLSSRNEMQKVIEAARQASMSNSLAQLLVPPVVPTPAPIVEQIPQQLPMQQSHSKDRRDSRDDKKDSSDVSLSNQDVSRKDRKDRSRSRSRDRNRKDRRDRDRSDRRRRSRSRSRDRRRRRSRSRSRGRDNGKHRDRKDGKKEDKEKEKERETNQGVPEGVTTLPNMAAIANNWQGQPPPAINPVLLNAGNPLLGGFPAFNLLGALPGQPLGGVLTPPMSLTPTLDESKMRNPRDEGRKSAEFSDPKMGRASTILPFFNSGGLNLVNPVNPVNPCGVNFRDGDMRGFSDNDQRMNPRNDGMNMNRGPNYNDMNRGPGFRPPLLPNAPNNMGMNNPMMNNRDGDFRNDFNSNFRGNNGPSGNFGNVRNFDGPGQGRNMRDDDMRFGGNNFVPPKNFDEPGGDRHGNQRNPNDSRGSRFDPRDEGSNRRSGSRDSNQASRDGASRFSRFAERDERDSMDDFNRNQQANDNDDFREPPSQSNFLGLQGSRFMPNQPGAQPPMRGPRESWPPGRGHSENFQERRDFRGPYEEPTPLRSDGSGPDSHHRDGRERERERNNDRGVKRGRPVNNDANNDGREVHGCCIELRGLGSNATYSDIRRAFNMFKIIIADIKFKYDDRGGRNAYVKLLDSEGKKKSLQLSNNITIDGKQLKLSSITDSDFEALGGDPPRRKDRRVSEDMADSDKECGLFVLVNGLPSSARDEDVTKVFEPARIEKVFIFSSSDGQKAAFVRFQKPNDAQAATKTRHLRIGDATLSVHSTTKKDYEDNVQKQRDAAMKVAEAIAKITETARLVESQITSEPSSKDGDVVGNGEEEEKRNSQTAIPKMADKHNSGANLGDHRRTREENQVPKENVMVPSFVSDCIIIKNLPLHATDRDICDFFSDVGLVPTRIHLMLDLRGQPSGDAFCEFAHPNQAATACTKNGGSFGKHVVTVHLVPREEMHNALGVSMPPNQNGPAPGPMMDYNGPPIVLSLENIPFRATNADVANFFDWNFNVTENDVMRRYNEKGWATGDARVRVRTPDVAMRAVRVLNNRRLMERPVRVSIL